MQMTFLFNFIKIDNNILNVTMLSPDNITT